MLKMKVTTIGSTAGLILSKEVLGRLGVQKGDNLFLTEAPDGGFRITPYDPEFERQLEVGEKVMRRYRDGLRTLAK
jgi:putative addiction module antidote